jgi:hypothetical protein
MKKILLLFVALIAITSCSLEPDEEVRYNVEFLPIEAVLIPEYVVPGHTYEVRAKFTKPNGCYLFDRFHSEKEGDAILIAVQTMVRVDNECKKYENQSIEEQAFTFSCDDAYTASGYIFKFYTGLDVEGNKTYTEVVIPVKP